MDTALFLRRARAELGLAKTLERAVVLQGTGGIVIVAPVPPIGQRTELAALAEELEGEPVAVELVQAQF